MNKTKIIEATLAFVFRKDLSKVLLIKKEKPIQHAGLLNGLGGKLETGESHIECVGREIQEEAGLIIPQSYWTQVGTMTWSNWDVSIWTCTIENLADNDFPEENVGWYPVSPVPMSVIENLEWLIPLCLDINQKIHKNETVFPMVDIQYQ